MGVCVGGQLRSLLLGLVLACLLGGTGAAEERPKEEPAAEEAPLPEARPTPGRIRRDIVALYSVNNPVPNQDVYNAIAQMVEMPLNHLGLRVHAFDVAAGPPPAALVGNARAIVMWFDKAHGLPKWVQPWLEAYQSEGIGKLIFLETLPGLGGSEDEQAWLKEFLTRLDLSWPGVFVSGGARVEVIFHKGESCELEASPRSRALHFGPKSATAAHDVWVSTRDRLDPEENCTPVLTAPWGGMALGPFLMRMGEGLGDRRWHIDPFVFLRDSLAMPTWPVPHPSVLFGRRMFTFHVDGDGFESLSAVKPGANCGVVMRDAVINKFLIPSTISIIVASLTPDLHIKEPTAKMKMARSIFDADWVEAASHGVLHPFDWSKPWGPAPAERANFGYPGLAGFVYSPAAEVGESLRFIDTRLLPEGKNVGGMLWTGESIAPASAIRAAEEMNCWNLNGGTFRWDAAHDSVGYVSPWGRTVNGLLQVYAGAANENEFSGFYDRSPGVFGHIATTIERTGKGRILKPAAVYAHFYSAERHLRLKALHKLIERWAFAEPTIPVFGSTYALAVQGAMKARVQALDDGWRLEGWGACRTARFDDEPREVDFGRSKNVLGANRIDGSLYVMLGPGSADLYLAQSPVAKPHLKESNHLLSDVALSDKGVRFRSESPIPRKIIVAGLPSSAAVELRVGDLSREVETDQSGHLLIALEPSAPSRVEVRLP